MLWIVAYDICCPRRLQRVARVLEKKATRCQKSVFVFKGSRAELDQLLDQAAAEMKPSEDKLQAWQLAETESPDGKERGAPVPVHPACIITAGTRIVAVKNTSRRQRDGTALNTPRP